jgi:threonine synthase
MEPKLPINTCGPLLLINEFEGSIGNSMRYLSTNRNLNDSPTVPPVSFPEALFLGQAPDQGLYMPEEIPRFKAGLIQELNHLSYPELAALLIHPYIGSEYISFDQLMQLTKEAYRFPIPLEQFDNQLTIMRLDRGPTASFKDFAAQFLARIMAYLNPTKGKTIILVATSGDTGSAIGEAFRGLPNFKVVILYPSNEISPLQKQQLDSIGKNVTAVEMQGKFDSCQRYVKRAFSDPDLQSLPLTSANSINIGRILPQIVYYVYGYGQTFQYDDPAVFVVPSGNLGNSLGCEFARRMGLPVSRILLATNANNEVATFLETGTYEKLDPSRACLSNAMNVGNPSNLARYFNLFGGTVDKDGTVYQKPDLEKMRTILVSESIDDRETIATSKSVAQSHEVLLEPHGAVGMAAWNRLQQRNPDIRGILLETAAPGKFPEYFKRYLNKEIPLPPSMNLMLERKATYESIPESYELFKTLVLDYATSSNESG